MVDNFQGVLIFVECQREPSELPKQCYVVLLPIESEISHLSFA